MALSGYSRSALFISPMPSAPSARMMASMVSGSYATGHHGGGHDRLVGRAADPRQHRHRRRPATGSHASGAQRGQHRARPRRARPARRPARSRGRGGPRGRGVWSWCQVRASLAAIASCRRYACSDTHHQASCAATMRARPTGRPHQHQRRPLRGPDQVIQHVMAGARGTATRPPCGCPPGS